MKRQIENILNPRRTKCLIREAKFAARRAAILGKTLAIFAVAAVAFAFATQGAAVAAVAAAALTVSASAVGLASNGAVLGLTPRFTNYIPGIQGVGASGIATVNVPVNRRYHTMRILTTNAAGALTDATTIVSLVELVVNGVVIRSGAPATFINIAKTYRYTPATGEIPIFFTEFWRNESPRAAEATSWDMFNQSTFVVRLTFLAPGGGVGIQSILADFDGKRNLRKDENGKLVPFLNIVKQTDITINAVSGTNNITNIPTNWPLKRLFLDVSANAINSIQIYADNNTKVLESTKAENAIMLNANDITATFFEYPVIFDYDARVDSALSTSDLNLQVVTSGALTLTAHVQQMINRFG
jgi:hypothetical protein